MESTITSHQEMEVNNNETQLEKQIVKDGGGQIIDANHVSEIQLVRTITVTDPEEWLCVAKLPPDTTEETFLDLLSEFGSVKESFLLVSRKTGKCQSQVNHDKSPLKNKVKKMQVQLMK